MSIEWINPAYNPEAQEIVINRDQRRGALIEDKGIYAGFRVTNHEGLEWVTIDNLVGEEKIPLCNLLLGNCDFDLLTHLKQGDAMRIIISISSAPIGSNGEYKRAIALVACDSGIIYLSPGFDLIQYNLGRRARKPRLLPT
ncbi:MAG: hypothetical protein HYU48_02040 [Candidatus Levybacteria bacterium]|nr:hypothetical protein [Candidatus Levybacteria bacterium]